MRCFRGCCCELVSEMRWIDICREQACEYVVAVLVRASHAKSDHGANSPRDQGYNKETSKEAEKKEGTAEGSNTENRSARHAVGVVESPGAPMRRAESAGRSVA